MSVQLKALGVPVLQIVAGDVLDDVAGGIEEEHRVGVPVAVVDDLGREAVSAVALGNRQHRRPRFLPLERLEDLVLGDVEREVIERRAAVDCIRAADEREPGFTGLDPETIRRSSITRRSSVLP